jgi:sigma-E factor negative regulatory protein RseB
MNAFGTVVNGYQVLVVGEAPAATVQRIATSVRYAPEAGKP